MADPNPKPQIVTTSTGKRYRTFVEGTVDSMDREEAIDDKKKMIELHRRFLHRWTTFAKQEEEFIASLQLEIDFLNSMNDQFFDVLHSPVEDE